MTAFSRANHPLRLAALFAGTLLAAGLVASAAGAVLYIVDDQRTGPAVADAPPDTNLDVPDGLVVLQILETLDELAAEVGFEPLLAGLLPETTERRPVFAATQPDEHGVRFAHVSYSAKKDTTVDGITGPTVVLFQGQGEPGPDVDGELRRIEWGNARALAATFACGDLVVDARFYFSPDAAPGEPFLNPRMTSAAEMVVDDLLERCG
jgi:hypothetical protein